MLITVVIPSYNHCAYIVQAIESVLNQSWQYVDLIVIDDGSTDGSPEIIQDLYTKRGGFRFISRENRGVISTLNEGISLAKGEFVCFCSSDDYLPPGSLECRANFLIEHPDYIAVFADVAKVDAKGSVIEHLMDQKRQELFSVADPIPMFINGSNLPLHSIMSRLAIFREIGGFDPRFKVCEDLDIQLLHFLKGRIGFIDQVVFCYRWHGENVSLKIRHFTARDKILLYRKYLEEIDQLQPYKDLIRRRLRGYYLKFGRNLSKGHGGLSDDRKLLRGGWAYIWYDPRLIWYLLKNEIALLSST